MTADILLRARRGGDKLLALLIDPDKQSPAVAAEVARQAATAQVDLLLVGGSFLTRDSLNDTVQTVKAASGLPVILFPGSAMQCSPHADAILFLSLISGRNPDLLIGQQVQAAPLIRRMDLETIATGYMLVDGDAATTASYMTQTPPLPADKPDLAAATALAGYFLGMQVLYLDAGSGARRPVSFETIRAVREATPLPLFVGGGIREPEQAVQALKAGADIVVVGTIVEENPDRLPALCQAVHTAFHLAS